LLLEIFESGVPPRFRVRFADSTGLVPVPDGQSLTIETERPDGSRQRFSFADRRLYLESVEEIPEPHEFSARVTLAHDEHAHHHDVAFAEHDHDHAAGADAGARDNNMRAAFVHIIADAAVSMLVIIGLVLAKLFGWVWMDPLAGTIGAVVIASWAYGLIRDTGAILLDMNPDRTMAERLRQTIETDGDQLSDLHLWRLGPGHLGAIICVGTRQMRDSAYYKARLARFKALSHVTVEVHQMA